MASVGGVSGGVSGNARIQAILNQQQQQAKANLIQSSQKFESAKQDSIRTIEAVLSTSVTAPGTSGGLNLLV